MASMILPWKKTETKTHKDSKTRESQNITAVPNVAATFSRVNYIFNEGASCKFCFQNAMSLLLKKGLNFVLFFACSTSVLKNTLYLFHFTETRHRF